MKIEGDTVIFKSELCHFKLERDGLKPNTERLLIFPEMTLIKTDLENPKGIIKKIRMECTADIDDEDFEPFEDFEPITRTLTSIEQIGELCGHYLFVFSWKHREISNE